MNELEELRASLLSMGLVDDSEDPPVIALSGGVSCDVWRVDLGSGPICVKRPLAKLRVSSEWRAPVERWRSEVEWLRTAHSIVPGAVPIVLAIDESRGFFALEYLEPGSYQS